MARLPAYIIDSFRSISDYENTGIPGAFKHGRALDVRKRGNTISCGQALRQEGSGVIVDLILFSVPAYDGNTYLFGDSGKIYKRTAFNTISVVHTDADGRITGAGQFLQANNKWYLFWTTATKLHEKEIPGASNWSDVDAGIVISATTYTYPKTNLTSKTWHTIAIASGSLLICNGDIVAAIFYDGSYTNEALRLIPGSDSKSIIDAGGQAVIAASSIDGKQNARIYLWDPTGLNYAREKILPAVNLNAIVYGEVMLIQADDNGNIFFSDFFNFLPVTSFPGGGKVNPGGVGILDGVSFFGVFGASDTTKNGIWSYGRKKKNQPFAFNFEYPIVCDQIGMIQPLGTEMLVSYKVGSSYYLYSTDPSVKQVGTYESLDLYAPEKLPPKEITAWPHITVLCKPLPAGTSIGIKYRMDKTGDWVAAKLQSGTELLTVAGAKRATFLVGSSGDIAEVQATLTPNGNTSPEITKILVGVE